jgi:hypothetical protein
MTDLRAKLIAGSLLLAGFWIFGTLWAMKLA